MKQIMKMATFPPSDRVMAPCVMTRCLYAQLSQQKFNGSAVFGRMPPPSSPDYVAYELGMKLACGFEILARRGASSGGFESDSRWPNFLSALNSMEYFRGNITGSQEYRRLLDVAKVHFLESISTEGAALLTRQQLASALIRETMSSSAYVRRT
jgi:hypothetical protein